MKKFLCKISIYVLIMLMLFLGIELALLQRPNEYSYKVNFLERNADRIEVLFLGHSHIEMGIAPQHMTDGTFNMAISGRLAYYDRILAERYISRLKKLRCVIIPYGYGLEYGSYKYKVKKKLGKGVFAKFQQDLTSTNRCMYYKYMDIAYSPFDFIYWSEIINSKLDFWGRLTEKDFYKLICCDSLGYVSMNLDTKSINWKRERLPSEPYYETEEAKLAFNDFIDQYVAITNSCKQSNVRLVVISTPVYKTYQEEMTQRGLENIKEIISSMKKLYPKVEYYNFMFDSRFEENDFYDASHLSEKGAEKFSKIVQKEVVDKDLHDN